MRDLRRDDWLEVIWLPLKRLMQLKHGKEDQLGESVDS